MPAAKRNETRKHRQARKASNSSKQSESVVHFAQPARRRHRSASRDSQHKGHPRRRDSASKRQPRRQPHQRALAEGSAAAGARVRLAVAAVATHQKASKRVQSLALALSLPHAVTAQRLSTELEPEPTVLASPYAIIPVDFTLNDVAAAATPGNLTATQEPFLPRGSYSAAISNSPAHQCVTWQASMLNHKLVAHFAVGSGAYGGPILGTGTASTVVGTPPYTLPFAYLAQGSGNTLSANTVFERTWNLEPTYWREVATYVDEEGLTPPTAALTGVHDGLVLSASQLGHRYVYVQASVAHPAAVVAAHTTLAPNGRPATTYDMRARNPLTGAIADGPVEFNTTLRAFRALSMDKEEELTLPSLATVRFETTAGVAVGQLGTASGPNSQPTASPACRRPFTYAFTVAPGRNVSYSPTPGVNYAPFLGGDVATDFYRAGDNMIFLTQPGWYRFDYSLVGDFPRLYQQEEAVLSIELSLSEGEYHMGYMDLHPTDPPVYVPAQQGPVRGFHSIHALPGWLSHAPLGLSLKVDAAALLISPMAIAANRGGTIGACQLSATKSLSSGLYLSDSALRARLGGSAAMDASTGFYGFIKPHAEHFDSWMRTAPEDQDGPDEQAVRALAYQNGYLGASAIDPADAASAYLDPPVFPTSGWLFVAIRAPAPAIIANGDDTPFAGALFTLAVCSQAEYTTQDVWALTRLPSSRNEAAQAIELIRAMPQYHENPLHFSDILGWLKGAATRVWRAAPTLINAAKLIAPEIAPGLSILGSGVDAIRRATA